MTTIIRADSAHDFLALVPALAGYTPARSLVCVAFRGPRTVGLLRYDLPRRARDRGPLVEAIVGVLCKMPDVDGIVPIAYTDEAWGRAGMPERPLLEMLVERAVDAGFAMRDAFSVAADGWAVLPERGGPAQRRPLELIDASPSCAHSAAGPLRRGAADLLEAPEPDPDLSEAIEQAVGELERLVQPRPPGERVSHPVGSGAASVGITADAAPPGPAASILDRLGDLVDPVTLGERIATRAGQALGPDEHAWLLHLSGRPAARDAIMLQFAFGPVIGEVALESVDAAVDEPCACDRGGHHDGPEPWCDGCGRDVDADDLLARLLTGQTSVRPDPERIERALEVLAVAIANAPVHLRPGALCIAAWLAWALGRGSAAGALVDRALADDPGHRMAGLLHAFIGSGALPEWAFSGAGTGAVSDR